VKAKRLLFQSFVDVADWRNRVRPLLTRHLLRLVTRQQQAQQPQQAVTIAAYAAVSPGAQRKNSPAEASIATLLRTAGEQLASESLLSFRESTWFGDARCVRLLVFAASLYTQKMQSGEFGSHETNSVYRHRQKLKLTGQERLYLIKVVLLDESLTKPGWYWASRWKPKISTWLPWLVQADRHYEIRWRALQFSDQIGFPLHRGRAGKAAYHALTDGSSDVRLAAVEYLAKYGRTQALKELRPVLSDTDPRVATEANNAMHVIRLRQNQRKKSNNYWRQEPPLTRACST